MAEGPILKTRRDLAQILAQNEFNITVTASKVLELLNLDETKLVTITSLLSKIKMNIKRYKRSVDSLNSEWWNHEIPWESNPIQITTSVSIESKVKKNLFSLQLQQQRIRLSSILEQIRETAIMEGSTPLEIAALVLQLLANECDNRKIAKLAKEVISSGGFSGITLSYVPVDKAIFLLDMLEMGRRKYAQLRQTLLAENIHSPSHSKVLDLRNVLVSSDLIQLYPNPHQPIGVQTPYYLQVQQTLERILTTLSPLDPEEFPLQFRIADGLDGSGCHTIYNQLHTNTNTKNYILFCFKPISISTASNRIIWQNQYPNSPFSQRPVFLCAAKECEKNIRLFMEDLINPDTEKLQNGITLQNGVVKVEIVRSMFDGKMSAILSGAGGASCQMCTATHDDLKDRDLIEDGFPINRTITDAIQLFGELENVEEFFALPSNERYNITHQPISKVNIIAASPLHSYTCILKWFNLLVYHLHIGKLKWSTTTTDIKDSMRNVQKIVQEKTG